MDTTTAILMTALVNLATVGLVMWLKSTVRDTKEDIVALMGLVDQIKTQTDGINSRLEEAARLSQAKTDAATAQLADAKVEVAVVTEKLEVARNGRK